MRRPKCNAPQNGHFPKVQEQSSIDIELQQQKRTRTCSCGYVWITMEVTLENLTDLRRKAHMHIMSEARKA